MTSNGKIDIYGADSISVHSQQDLNFTADRDILHSIDGDKFIFLLQCKDSLDNFSPCQIQGNSVHVMNKYTLEDNLSA